MLVVRTALMTLLEGLQESEILSDDGVRLRQYSEVIGAAQLRVSHR